MLDGAARLQAEAAGVDAELRAGGFAYLPPDTPHRLTSAAGAGLLLFERRYALAHAGGQPKVWAHVCTQGVQDDPQPAVACATAGCSAASSAACHRVSYNIACSLL